MAKWKNNGFSMIEVLVTILILMIGLLGLAGLQTRALTTQVESYQRAQALVLVKDMSDRINANRQAAICYAMAANQYLGTGATFPVPAVATCATAIKNAYDTAHATENPPVTMPLATATADANTVVSDLNSWNDALLGAAEVQSTSATNVGAMIGARGCVFQLASTAIPGSVATTPQYLVVVSWQGMNVTAAPDASTSGQCGHGLYKDRNGNVSEQLHRVVTLPIAIADLQ